MSNKTESKQIYEIRLYNDGQFEIIKSENKIIVNGIFLTCETNKPLALEKQCYKEDITKTKKYLVNKRIKKCYKELNKIKQQLSMYKTAKNKIDNDK